MSNITTFSGANLPSVKSLATALRTIETKCRRVVAAVSHFQDGQDRSLGIWYRSDRDRR
jgi:hypothetical protein